MACRPWTRNVEGSNLCCSCATSTSLNLGVRGGQVFRGDGRIGPREMQAAIDSRIGGRGHGKLINGTFTMGEGCVAQGCRCC